MSDTRDIPLDNGRRPAIDPVTGEVHGSGVGAGGGQPGEDFENDAATGDAYPQTGGEETDHIPGSKGLPASTSSLRPPPTSR